VLRGDPYATRDDAAPRAARGSEPKLDTRGSQPAIEDDDHVPEAPAVAWGTEDDSPAPAIVLAPDMPLDAPASDPDPLTFPLVEGPGAQLGDDVASVVGVRFVPAGRIQWCDAGDTDFAPGERVIVDSDRGQRLAWIATTPGRRPVRDRSLRRVIRRANDNDLRGEREGESDRAHALRVAKDVAAALRLPLKVFRVEKTGGKLNVYYTSDERLDLRDFVREVGQATNARLELRQLGVRDEAKVVGGIGSCGLTLCCTTWLPDFVPVSIKMAKDQGLVLSPTKVSGQCGRLKCCLVYEQAGYAELRKGLPKLGKRVISPKGEGRVVEVDVLRQRVRVSYGAGDTEVLPATEVKPMFPSGNQPREPEAHDEPDEPGLPDS
jgi:cell fate regulator YaaT (PSP1 superfamily)